MGEEDMVSSVSPSVRKWVEGSRLLDAMLEGFTVASSSLDCQEAEDDAQVLDPELSPCFSSGHGWFDVCPGGLC